MTTFRPYIVIDAPGYYGSRGNVYSAHATIAAAIKTRRGVGATTIAHNEAERNGGAGYVRGDRFYADMPPKTIDHA